MIAKTPLLLLTIIGLSGCAMQEGDFPSLAKRPFEDGPTIAEPDSVVPPPAASLSPAVQAAVEKATATSNAAHNEFLARLPAVQKQVRAARNSAVSSESWVVAQMEMAALEMTRSPSVEALADMDRLYLQQLQAEADGAAAGSAAIVAEQKQGIAEQVSKQQSAIDGLKDIIR
tara:strand:- start:44 stop:562 length:519 start_codon:yes stop_codon:yes gene_type:complete